MNHRPTTPSAAPRPAAPPAETAARPPVRHLLVLSDLHLCDGVAGDDLWMRYRQHRFFPDEELRQLFELGCAEAEAEGGSLELVFNGDLFDFDAPPAVGAEVVFGDPPRLESAAVETLGRILADHPTLVDGLGRVLAAGHRVVFVSGNHDAQLSFPAVRALLAERLVAAAGADVDPVEVRARVVFRAWFHATADGVHLEHGNQYDSFCAFRYPMTPFTDDGTRVQPTMGSLSFRHLVSRMGYFNPHVDSSFMLSLPRYLAHWARHYLFSRRSLAVAWAVGAVRVGVQMVRSRLRHSPARAARNLAACAHETGADPAALARHAALFAPPSEEVLHAIVRELWLDRAALLVAALAAVAVGAVVGWGTALVAALVAALAIGAYESVVPKAPLADTYRQMAVRAREVRDLHGARAVIFGHSHEAYATWEGETFLGNCGTWSAAFRDPACTVAVDDGRPVIWLRARDARPLEGGLFLFRGGMLVPVAPRAARQEVPRGARLAIARPGDPAIG